MLKELDRLPFEERNEKDFEDLTRKIWDAITTIKKTRSIPATQEKLSELVGCTRKTLHNRGWPVTELKNIKEQRKATQNSNPKKTTVEHRLTSEKHIARGKLLIRRVRNLQEQNGKLFDRVQELEDQKSIAADTVSVLEAEIATLKDVNRTLEKEVRRLKQKRSGRTNVVSIKAMTKSEEVGKEKK